MNSGMAVVFGKQSETLTKVERYKWKLQDEPGELRLINKELLIVNHDYQRTINEAKVKLITQDWSWVACGVIIVAERGGMYWVVDGQHRVVCAKRRSDIDKIPCIVFKTKDVREEAKGFLNANTARKPISGYDKFRALVAANDEIAIKVSEIFEELGIEVSPRAQKAKSLKCIIVALAKAKEDLDKFNVVIRMCADLSSGMVIYEKLLEGLWYLHSNVEGGLTNRRLKERIENLGARKLIDAAIKASVYYSKGGSKVWGEGMLEEINKNLRNRFVLTGNG